MSQFLANALNTFMQQAYWHRWSKRKALDTVRQLRRQNPDHDCLAIALRTYFAS